MPKFMDLTLQTFEGFSVKEYVGRVNGNNTWICVCFCGKEFRSNTGNIRSGHTTSCGCKRDLAMSIRTKVHGESNKTPEYRAWRSMRYRVLNPDKGNKRYHIYGGRGIKICDRWLESFENFLADMGRKPSPEHSIDRKDNDGDYCPENCRWATSTEQAYNRRTNRIVYFNGVSKPIFQHVADTGLSYTRICTLVKNSEKVLTTC